jgi:hypothetical protein
MPRKTQDPKRIAVLDRIDHCRADFEKWYARLKRAFNRLEKIRRQIVRLQRQLAKSDN